MTEEVICIIPARATSTFEPAAAPRPSRMRPRRPNQRSKVQVRRNSVPEQPLSPSIRRMRSRSISAVHIACFSRRTGIRAAYMSRRRPPRHSSCEKPRADMRTLPSTTASSQQPRAIARTASRCSRRPSKRSSSRSRVGARCASLRAVPARDRRSARREACPQSGRCAEPRGRAVASRDRSNRFRIFGDSLTLGPPPAPTADC